MKALGYNWDLWDDVYSTRVNERATVSVWKFGSIYQCKIFIDYPIAKSRVGICLNPKDTLLSAMDKCITYAKEFITKTPITVDEMFSINYKNWYSIYKTRIDIIDHLFFVIGNGYEWVDGALINTSPEDSFEQEDKTLEKYMLLLNLPQEDKTRPLPDDGKQVSFYPVSKHCSNICKIPDDVLPDWLELCREAAILLRDRSGNTSSFESVRQQESNRKIGAEIVNEIETRFPQKKIIENDFQNKFKNLKNKIK